jgi:hypothetical protein
MHKLKEKKSKSHIAFWHLFSCANNCNNAGAEEHFRDTYSPVSCKRIRPTIIKNTSQHSDAKTTAIKKTSNPDNLKINYWNRSSLHQHVNCSKVRQLTSLITAGARVTVEYLIPFARAHSQTAANSVGQEQRNSRE